ncbi:DUF1805 domain-containing protein [Candidatus Micrarchaeota archaeon]|nr:DUF1805 domain-containing protein [Candidatus Micrarchaeota archaeon]
MEQTIDFAGKKYQGIIYSLGNVPLIIVKAKKGYVACSYIEKGSAEKLGDVAAFVSGVKCFEDVFRAKIKTATMWAEDIGIREGMSVKKALEIMDDEKQ